MIFNFYLGNHKDDALSGMSDTLAPVYRGLEGLGHRVIGFGRDLLGAPAVNVLVEAFADDAFTDALLAMKSAQKAGLIFGVICPEDIEGEFITDPALLPAAPPPPDPARRRGNLMRVLPSADFVWPLLPQVPAYEAICGPGKAAFLQYGFASGCADPWPIRAPGLRDIDVVVYGVETPYRNQIAEELRRNGLTAISLDRAFFPDFLAEDVIRRTKVFVEIRRNPAARFLSPAAVVKGLHFGTAVALEKVDDNRLDFLDGYASAWSYGELVRGTIELARSDRFVDIGAAAQARFRAGASMVENMRTALALPIFERLAAA